MVQRHHVIEGTYRDMIRCEATFLICEASSLCLVIFNLFISDLKSFH